MSHQIIVHFRRTPHSKVVCVGLKLTGGTVLIFFLSYGENKHYFLPVSTCGFKKCRISKFKVMCGEFLG